MIRSIIVEDEPMHLRALKSLLNNHCQDVDILDDTDSVSGAKELIRKLSPDLVFLDIELIDGTGFDLLLQLDRLNFHIIFVTCHEDKAVTAFRFSATDYLVKPVNIDDLKAAVEKVRQGLTLKAKHNNIQMLLETIAHVQDSPDIVNIPGIDGFKVIRIDDIIICEADGFCTIFYLAENRKIVSSKNLKYYEEMLVPKGFLRVHNSFMINLKHVREYSSEGLISLIHDYTAPLGNKYKKDFMDFFGRKK